jgi:hypothetical protein
MKQIFFLLAAVSLWSLDGNQILHSKPNNKPYENTSWGQEFAEAHLKDALPLPSDAEVLRYASDQVGVEGVYLELGVWKGRTINFLAALNPHRTVYGFDSFRGLPEDWEKGDHTIPKGAFAFQPDERPPYYLLNVQIYKGLFDEMIPQFLEEVNQPIAFVHVDCDIYSSTSTAFEILGPRMQEGTVLLFDEFYNYPNYRAHEWKAFEEFLEAFSFDAEYIAFNPLHEQVAVRLHKKY